MRVKICGVTRPEDAELAVRLGATDIGCVLVRGTARCIDVARARQVFAGLPDCVCRVLVFRNTDVETVELEADATGVQDVQLHRTSESVAAELENRGLRVRRVVEAPVTAHTLTRATAERPLVIDVAGGGSGRRFDWTHLSGKTLKHAFVAGGITPENVSELLELHPGGIDVSSGVECSPGLKAPHLLRAFFAALSGADRVSTRKRS